MQKSRNHSQIKSAKQQRGAVIVVALFVVALVASMSYVMMARMSRDTQRAQLIIRDAQAMHYINGTVAWARDVLINNWQQQKKGKPIDQTSVVMPQSTEEDYLLEAILYDAQGRFNLNQVQRPQQMQTFERLLLTVTPSLPVEKAQGLVVALREWMAPNAGDGGMNQYYLDLPVPYRAAHRPMLMTSELRLVKGFDQSVYQALKPYVIALPEDAALNIQSAEAPVVMTISPKISPSLAKDIIATRQRKPFVTTEQFMNLPAIKNHNIDFKDVKITTTSQYFLLESKVSIEKQRWVIYTLLKRETKNKKATVKVVWQSRSSE